MIRFLVECFVIAVAATVVLALAGLPVWLGTMIATWISFYRWASGVNW